MVIAAFVAGFYVGCLLMGLLQAAGSQPPPPSSRTPEELPWWSDD